MLEFIGGFVGFIFLVAGAALYWRARDDAQQAAKELDEKVSQGAAAVLKGIDTGKGAAETAYKALQTVAASVEDQLIGIHSGVEQVQEMAERSSSIIEALSQAKAEATSMLVPDPENAPAFLVMWASGAEHNNEPMWNDARDIRRERYYDDEGNTSWHKARFKTFTRAGFLEYMNRDTIAEAMDRASRDFYVVVPIWHGAVTD
ncbi:MAG: hypothetical protein JSS66_06440 [Armatimonadetes bacterium]|nr:hypothetical protein [Armatimonadota bacterium]